MTEDSGKLFDLLAKVDLTLGGVSKSVAKQTELQARASMAAQPAFMPIGGQIIIPANGFGVVALTPNRPTQGRFWFVRRLVVGGITPATVAAGRVDVFVSALGYAQVTSFAQVALTDWIDTETSLPNIAFYGSGEVVVRPNEALHLIISGATPGQQYVVGGLVEEVQDAANAQAWGL